MYSLQLRGFGQGPDDPPELIPGFTPAQTSSPSGGGVDWSSVINTVLNDVTQIIRPGASSPYPVYNPTTTALSNATKNLVPLALFGGLAYLVLKKGR